MPSSESEIVVILYVFFAHLCVCLCIHQCRCKVKRVNRNHLVNNLVEAFLRANPGERVGKKG